MIAIHDQISEDKVDSENAEGNCFPLCYSSFELLRQRLRVSNKKQKFEVMENFIDFIEMDDEKDEQHCNQSQQTKK